MPPQRKQRENRRRTGCFQCKEKHVQCTEEKSQCRRCVRLGLKCERGLKLIFREDAVQRRICFGREGAWRKRPKSHAKTTVTDAGSGSYSIPLDQYRDQWIFLNTTYEDFLSRTSNVEEADMGTSQPNQSLQVTAGEKSRLLVSQPWEHPLTSYSEVESYLLDYFIRGIAPSCSISSSENPYISLITPLCFVYSTLRNALVAVAANQLRLLGDARFIKEGCIFKDRALQGLQRAMSSTCLDYGVTATVLMLCFYDISDGCDPSWVAHLRGGLELMSCPPRNCTESDSLESFFTMYFVAHDIMGRTSRNRLQGESSSTWLEGDDMDQIDTVMGCSRRLMSLINTISNLASRRSEILVSRELTSSEIEEFASDFNHTENSLRTLKQSLPKHSEDEYNLGQIAETKRLAALLYLAERLNPETSIQLEANLDGSGATRETIRQSPRREKRRLISSIINIVSTLPDSATLLWPLFVLGNSGLENEGERRFVLERLGRMQQTRNLGSVRRARTAVKRAFCISDLGHANACGRVWGEEGCGFISLA